MLFTLFLTVLPLLARSTPIATKRQTIALGRRSILVNRDGSVNSDALRAHANHVTKKVQKGLTAFERNTGHAHPSAHKAHHAKRGVGNVPLTDDNDNLWYGSISVGTPPADYTVAFDTGSSDLFLPGPACSDNCEGHKKYNPSSSSTATDTGKTFAINSDDGSSVSGEQFTDTVQIAGLAATDQTLGAADKYSSGYAIGQFPPDGLMGMAFPSISSYPADPVFQTLVAQGQTDAPKFAFKIANTGSQLTIGGVDDSLYTGSITYTPVTHQGFWQVDVESIAVNGYHSGGFSGIIDTGSKLVVGDPNAVKQFYDSIPGSKDASSTVGAGYYTVPCNSVPTVSLTFSGQSFEIAPGIFNLGPSSSGSEDCVGGVKGSDTGGDFWVIGDVFLQNVYSVFDVGENRVGFATLA
jgi:cathepsin D